MNWIVYDFVDVVNLPHPDCSILDDVVAFVGLVHPLHSDWWIVDDVVVFLWMWCIHYILTGGQWMTLWCFCRCGASTIFLRIDSGRCGGVLL